jgi:hypothetical protein
MLDFLRAKLLAVLGLDWGRVINPSLHGTCQSNYGENTDFVMGKKTHYKVNNFPEVGKRNIEIDGYSFEEDECWRFLIISLTAKDGVLFKQRDGVVVAYHPDLAEQMGRAMMECFLFVPGFVDNAH